MDRFGVAGSEPGIRVKNEKGATRTGFDPGLDLSRATAFRPHDPSPGRHRSIRGFVAAAAVDHHHLDPISGRAGDGANDPIRLVECRNHHRKFHRATIARRQSVPAATAVSKDRALTGFGRLPITSGVSASDPPKFPNAPAPESEPSAPTYAAAGVDLDHDEGFIDEIGAITKPTLRPEILSSIGGFAGMFKAPERYQDPIFVAGADGVGTKLKLATTLGRYDTVGIDCVAMVVNDLIVQGAEPLVFLDYLAMDRLDRELAKQALRGVAEGCRRAGCTLLGGETASMPGMYRKDEIELVGFGVGVVDRDKIIDGSTISHGDTILGMASSGLHSNGYSLVRRIIDAEIAADRLDLRAEVPELNTTLASALLAPTRIYVKPLLNLMRDFDIKGLVHITGGGFGGNVPRVLPKSVRARIDPSSWPRPAIFGMLQNLGNLTDSEMLRVFNCGIGMLLVVPPEQA
jgi:phosphoribosylformylglycinamidine cyclo-ligase